MKRIKVLILVLSLTVPALWFTWFPLAILAMGKNIEVGVIGDAFGPLNTFFSGMAFVAIFASLLDSRRQAKAQEQRHRDLLAEQNKAAAEEQKRHSDTVVLSALTAYAEMCRAEWLANESKAAEAYAAAESEAESITFNRERYDTLCGLKKAFDDGAMEARKPIAAIERELRVRLEAEGIVFGPNKNG